LYSFWGLDWLSAAIFLSTSTKVIALFSIVIVLPCLPNPSKTGLILEKDFQLFWEAEAAKLSVIPF